MCLAVPGKVMEIEERDGTRMATVDFGGVVKDVCLEYLPDLQVGEYTIVHVGFALQRLDEASALQSLALFQNLGLLEEECGDPWEQAAGAAADPTTGEPATSAEHATTADPATAADPAPHDEQGRGAAHPRTAEEARP